MPKPVTVKYGKGLKQLRNSLGRFTKEFDPHVLEVMLAEAPRIEEEAKMRAPVLTGNLRDHITVRVIQVGPHKYELRGVSTAIAQHTYEYDYAPLQHETHATKSHYLSEPFAAGVERIKEKL